MTCLVEQCNNLQTLRSLDLVELEGRGHGTWWRLANSERGFLEGIA